MTDTPSDPIDAAAGPAPGDDMILPFQLERADIRGRLVRLDSTLDRILAQHRYPASVSALVSEAVLLTALIGQAIKLRWRFSLQIRGEGAVRLIATDYFAPERTGEPGRIRAYASFDRGDAASHAGRAIDLLGHGVFGLTIDQGRHMTPYQGLTPLSGGSLSASAEIYFAQSEQLATRFRIFAAEAQTPGMGTGWRAGGLMLQQLPQSPPSTVAEGPSGAEGLMTADDVAAMGAREEDWNRVNILADTVEVHELIGPHTGPHTLLTRLFHRERARVYPARSVRFGCTCSAQRVEAALAQYSAKDIAHMTTEEGEVVADCQFCSAQYRFDPSALGFEATRGSGTG